MDASSDEDYSDESLSIHDDENSELSDSNADIDRYIRRAKLGWGSDNGDHDSSSIQSSIDVEDWVSVGTDTDEIGESYEESVYVADAEYEDRKNVVPEWIQNLLNNGTYCNKNVILVFERFGIRSPDSLVPVDMYVLQTELIKATKNAIILTRDLNRLRDRRQELLEKDIRTKSKSGWGERRLKEEQRRLEEQQRLEGARSSSR